MIVKDEEEMLPTCLRSVSGCVDDIVVVDTGSTDKTIQIARDFKARVYHHPWEGHFAKHQNQAISYAHSDWILRMDADEELAEGSGEVIGQAIRNRGADAFLLTILSYFNHGASCTRESKIRVFRKRPTILYKSIIHEQLEGYEHVEIIPAEILHYGYDLEGSGAQAKHQRTTTLIQRQIAKDPKNYFHHLNLAACYSTHFQFEDAIQEGLEAIRLAYEQGIDGPNLPWAYYIVSFSHLKNGDLDQAEQFALKAVHRNPDHLDSYFVLCNIYHARKDWGSLAEAAQHFLRTIELLHTHPERFASSIVHMANEEWRIRIALGDRELHRAAKDLAHAQFVIALQKTPLPAGCQRIIGDCYRAAGLWQHAKEHYMASLKIIPDDPESLLALAVTYKHLNEPEKHKALILQMEDNERGSPELWFERGLIQLKDGDYKTSIDSFEESLKFNPDSRATHLNLALAYKGTGDLGRALHSNLRAVELSPRNVDSRINLAHLLYDMNQLDLAREQFEFVLDRSPDSVEIRMLYCELLARSGEINACGDHCGYLLETLGLPAHSVGHDPAGLAPLFLLVGQSLQAHGKPHLSQKAVTLAKRLDPHLAPKNHPPDGKS